MPDSNPLRLARFVQNLTSTDSVGGKGIALLNWIGPWTGAVVRSLADYFEDDVSVMHFLSLPERVKIRLRTTTSVDAAIHRAAIQKALDTGKGVITIPEGLYWTNPDTPISPLSNQIIRGHGLLTEIRAIGTASDSYNVVRIADVFNVTMEDMLIIGERQLHTTAGTGYVTGDIVSLTSQTGAGAGMRGVVTAAGGRIQRIDLLSAYPGNGLYVSLELVNVAAITGTGVGGTWKVLNRSVKTWQEGQTYSKDDQFIKPGDGKAYAPTANHVAGATFAADLALGLWEVVNPAGETVFAPYAGESGMCVGVYQATKVRLRRITARDAWGDGIYFGGNGAGQCVDVQAEDCDCDGNRRQGLTVAAAKDWKVIRGMFRNTGGTLPAAGIDIEPNSSVGDADVENGEINGATCYGNYGAGITAALSKLKKLRVINCDSFDNGGDGGYFTGLGDGFELEGGNWLNNGLHGLYFAGTSTAQFNGGRVSRPRCVGNALSGITVRFKVLGMRLAEPVIWGNQEHGIVFQGAQTTAGVLGSVTDCALIGGDIRENGLKTHNVFSNVWIGKDTPFLRVKGVTIRRGANANKPAFGIRVNVNLEILLENNDVYLSGNTGNIGSEVAANDFATTAGALPSVKLRNNSGFKTESRVLSTGVSMQTAGVKTFTIPHGCAYKPSNHHAQFSLVNPSGYDIAGYFLGIRSVDATNVAIDYKLTTGTGAAQLAYIALNVERPATL